MSYKVPCWWGWFCPQPHHFSWSKLVPQAEMQSCGFTKIKRLYAASWHMKGLRKRWLRTNKPASKIIRDIPIFTLEFQFTCSVSTPGWSVSNLPHAITTSSLSSTKRSFTKRSGAANIKTVAGSHSRAKATERIDLSMGSMGSAEEWMVSPWKWRIGQDRVILWCVFGVGYLSWPNRVDSCWLSVSQVCNHQSQWKFNKPKSLETRTEYQYDLSKKRPCSCPFPAIVNACVHMDAPKITRSNMIECSAIYIYI